MRSVCAVAEAGVDPTTLDQEIIRAITTVDPVLANLRITLAHYHLSLALRTVLAPAAGANFHTWATWGSQKAGRTIRQADLPALPPLARLLGGSLGLLGGTLLAPGGPQAWGTSLLGALLGSWSLGMLAGRRHAQAGRLILAGNRTVLAEIGRASARFVAAYQALPAPDPARLAAFLATLRPGPTARGGQDLLRLAFTHYAGAGAGGPAATEHLLLGNLYAILHEHIRLQPYIAGAMPRGARRLITRALLSFTVGNRTLHVSADVPLWAGGADPVGSLTETQAELRRFLAGPGGWDPLSDGRHGSGAGDWTALPARMHYISALFPAGHADPALFRAPYSPAQCATIAAGRIPAGPL